MRYVLTLVLFSTVTLCSFGQNGTLESQTPIAISKTDLWGIISQNDSLKPDYAYANQLNYAEITYKSDSLSINGLLIAPKAKGQIAITIDDVPNTISYQKNDFTAGLLNVLDSLDVPFTIFINENKIYKTEFLDKNKDLLKKWIENDQAIIGNHTYSHSRYSAVGFDDFVKDIELGEALTNEYASEKNKEVAYFRFPFNDMGKDSIQHMQMREYLTSKGYITAPFTVESSDWMFDVIYRHYLESGQTEKANEIGKLYVNKTLELIAFFEAMSDSIYHRPVKQIYLCHDNAINTRYLAEIIERLQKENYEIVSLDESMTDDVYRQEDRYYKKWGISWLYRWMSTQQERVEWMNQEPDLTEVEKTYNEIVNKE